MLIVLSWFSSGYSLRELARQWKTSTMFCYREFRHLIPILLEKLRIIKLFGVEFLKLFPRPIGEFMVNGAVDCTCQRRYRVHPGQAKYYRGQTLSLYFLSGYDGVFWSSFLTNPNLFSKWAQQ